MVCSSCTLLHPLGVTTCYRCGQPLCTKLQRVAAAASDKMPTTIGIGSSISLLACLAVALMLPGIAAQTLAAGAYFGIISITNIWLSVSRDVERDWLQGTRGLLYSAALLISLVGELARMQGIDVLSIPMSQGNPIVVPVPSALAMELVAAVLVVLDPLVVRPLLQWIQDGVEHSTPDQ
jgi:hypothetical protein